VVDVGVVGGGVGAEGLVLPLGLDLLLDGDLLLVRPILGSLVKALLRSDRVGPHFNLILFVVLVGARLALFEGGDDLAELLLVDLQELLCALLHLPLVLIVSELFEALLVPLGDDLGDRPRADDAGDGHH